MTKADSNLYKMQAEICAALSNPVRLHIIDLLAGGEKTNSALIKILEIPKANLTQHLKVLKDVGIVKSRKEGLFQYVSLAIPQVKDACSLIRRVLYEKISENDRVASAVRKQLGATQSRSHS